MLDLRTVAEYVHRELNGNATGPPNNNNAGTSMRYRGQIASVTSSIPQGQPLPPGGAAGQLQQHSVQQSPHLVRPPIFTRLLSIVRSFLRSFGIRIWECLWLLPIPNVFAWFSSRKTDRIEGEGDEEEVGEEGEDHLDKSGAELKGDKKPQQQVTKGALPLHLSTVYFSHLSYIQDQLRKCIHISKPLIVISSCCR